MAEVGGNALEGYSGSMAPDPALELDRLSADDLAALRLSAQVMAHRAALAGLPRVEMFFERLQAEADAETAARAQLGSRAAGGTNPWLVGGLSSTDQQAVADYLGLLADNTALPATLRDLVRHLISVQRLS
jgi:hypothetical protein